MIDRLFWMYDRKKFYETRYRYLVDTADARFSMDMVKYSTDEEWAQTRMMELMELWDFTYPKPSWLSVSPGNAMFVFSWATLISIVLAIGVFGFWFVIGHPGCWMGTGAGCDPPKFFWQDLSSK